MKAPRYDAVVFDFDGTLVDSDDALVDAFVALGVPRSTITFGHAIAEECQRLGLDLDAYAAAYDEEVVKPYPGVDEVVAHLGRWAVCSNKHPRSATAELQRLGWTPEVVMCADAFDWAHKTLGPVLRALDLAPARVAMVGDTEGDLRCALDAGCNMYWAGWNPRVPASVPEGVRLETPAQLLDLYR